LAAIGIITAISGTFVVIIAINSSVDASNSRITIF
jgi:hypothetical protein